MLKIQKSVEVIKNKAWFEYFVDLIPANPIDSAARAFSGEIVAVMFFAVM